MPRSPQYQRLLSIIEPVCLAAGFEVFDLRFVLEQGGWTLRVAVDVKLPERAEDAGTVDLGSVPEDRVDLQDCEDLSRELSAVLDVEDPIPQAFSLEVSSPGIDRPLRTAAHFQYFTGSEAKIQLAQPLMLPAGERRNFKGMLKGVTDGRVSIDCDGTTFELAIDDIDHAKLVPDWDAVMKGRSGVGGQTPKPIKPGHRPSQKAPSQKKQGQQRNDDKPGERPANDARNKE